MSYRAKVELIKAREIIAGFLLWHDPAYKHGPSESLEKLKAEAQEFLWPDPKFEPQAAKAGKGAKK